MKDPIEERLERLQPASLPNDLMARLIVARPQPAATPPPLPTRTTWLGWVLNAAVMLAVIAVCAAISFPVMKILQARSLQAQNAALASAAAAALESQPASLEPSDVRVFAPVEERSYLIAERDLGVIDAEPSHPVRLVHRTWLDDTTYRGDDGTSTRRHAATRAEIVPVLLEVY